MMRKTCYNIRLYHPDHLFSVSLVTERRVAIVQQFAYMPYGELLVEGSSVDLDYRFSAKETDRETGLSYFGARYYDPTAAMWLGVDPVFHAGSNAYAYCLGNPINLIDPNGMDEYGVSRNGEVALINKTNDKKDLLISGVSIDKNGQVVRNKDGSVKGLVYDKNGKLKNKTIEVSKGTFTNRSTSKKMYGGHLYKFNDKKEAEAVFKFMAKYTNVEWSFFNLKFLEIFQLEDFYISTSHKKYEEGVGPTLIKFYNNQDLQEYAAHFLCHSHPIDYEATLEYNVSPSDKDMELWRRIRREKDKESDINIEFSIYCERDNNYHPFTPRK